MKVFVSYSVQNTASTYIRRFCERLEDALSALGDKNETHVLYDDSLREGDNWKVRLAEMLNEAEVVVALYSPLYFQSAPCGQELSFFMERIPGSANASTTPILPVWWHPMPQRDKDGFCNPPSFNHPRLDTLQHREKNPETFGEYSTADIARKGLDLFIQNDQLRDFKAIIDFYVNALAERIKVLADSHAGVLMKNTGSFDQAVNIFKANNQAIIAPDLAKNMNPSNGSRIHFIVLAAHPDEIVAAGLNKELVGAYRDNGGTDWRPFWPDDRFIGACLQGIVYRNFGYVETVLVAENNPETALAIAAEVEARGQPLFFVIDAWSSKLAHYANFVSKLSERNLPYCAVLVPFLSSVEQPQLIKGLRDLLAAREAVDDPLFQTYIATSEKDLEQYVAQLYEKNQGKISPPFIQPTRTFFQWCQTHFGQCCGEVVMAESHKAPGRIVTFYSYKGGTGRSLLLANVALVLASNDRKVAVIDWDLEAPGLHRYFKPFITDADLSETPGLLDMLTQYWDTLIEGNTSPNAMPKGWEQQFLDIHRYAITLNLTGYSGNGRIVFMPAGQQNTAYSSKVSNFDWDAFYAEAGGRGFIEALCQKLISKFDYVLIDSRTGVSDTSGICTIHLPHDLVVCFTYNNQNVLGAAAVAASAAQARMAKHQPRDHGDSTALPKSPLRILPVPTRVDSYLGELLQQRRQFAQELLNWAVPEENRNSINEYWLRLEQPYRPEQSYVELLACLADAPGDPRSLLAAIEEVTRRITNGEVQRWIPMFSDEQRYRLHQSMLTQEGTGSLLNSQALQKNLPDWTDQQLDDEWPVLIRLIRLSPQNPNALEFRAVSARLLEHQHQKVNSLIQRGLVLAKPGEAGMNNLELSGFARLKSGWLSEKLKAHIEQNRTLLDIEEVTDRWRTSTSHDTSLLKSQEWIQAAKQSIEQLRIQRAFAPGEELYLAMSEQNIANAAIEMERKQGRWKKAFWSNAPLLSIILISGAFSAMLFKNYRENLIGQLLENKQSVAQKTDEAKKLNHEVNKLQIKISQQNSKMAQIDKFTQLLDNGHDAFANKKFLDAVEFFNQAVAVVPKGNADVYRARAITYEQLKNTAGTADEKADFQQRMLRDYEQWVAVNPVAERHLQVAEVLLKVGEIGRAKSQLDKAVQRTPQDGLSVNAKALALKLTNTLFRQKQLSENIANDYQKVFNGATYPTVGN